MKKLNFYLIFLLICISCVVFGESVSFVPTTKIKVCVININNISGSMADGENIFEYLYNNKYLMAGNTSYDMNFSFYNPRGNQDSIDYWKLDIDDISKTVLNQYDVVLLPLNNNFTNLPDNKQKVIAQWVCEGGVLWLDNFGVNITNPLFLPLGDFSINGDATSSNINLTSSLRSYPFNTNFANWANGKGGIVFDSGPFAMVSNQVFKSDDLINGIAKVGAGKVIHTGRSYTMDKSHIYECMNLLFSAFEPVSNYSYAKIPSILGQSLNITENMYGFKPLVMDGMVLYVNGSKLYADGENLTSDVNGSIPENDLSAPACMGDSDILVYDSKCNLFLCSGLKFDNNGNIDKSDVTWLKLYDADKDCINTIKYAPITYGYWVYFVDDESNLHVVYTKELNSGKAKYSWITKGGLTSNTVNVAGPVLSSRKDCFGSYVTEVSWITNNDLTDTSYFLNSIPVMVNGEISKKQPQFEDEQRIIKLNYSGFPSAKGVESFEIGYAGGTETTPDIAFIQLSSGTNVFKAYETNNTSKYDFKINTNATGTKQKGIIQFNVKKVDKEYKFADSSNYKDKYTNAFKYEVTYVPRYTNAIRSQLTLSDNIKLYKNLQYTTNGYIYQERKENDTDSKGNMTYVLKHAFSEDATNNTQSKYANWAFLPHTGFNNLIGPLNSSEKITVYPYIDWGFPYYLNSNNANVYVNGLKTIGNKVYISLTASLNDMFKRSAIVCLDSTKKPAIKIVDKNRNSVNLKYNQERTDGNRVANYKVRLYQPSPYETDFTYGELLFDVNASDYDNGIIEVDNMAKFIRSKKSLLFTSSLPAFVQLEATTKVETGSQTTVKSYLPIYPGTCPTLDITSYNSVCGETSMPVWNGTSNDDVVLYADLSDWNLIEWYSVLPGNAEVLGEPIVSGDKVTLVGYEMDEYNKTSQNKLYTIDPKGNIIDGLKVRNDQIKVTDISNDVTINDDMAVSMGTNKVALGTDSKIYVLENNKSLVIDNTNLLELDSSGNVAWRLSKVDYTDGGSNNYDFTLENPVRARYVFDNNHIAVADAGTKTIFIIDKNGKLKSADINSDNGMYWIFNSFVDTYGLLRSGSDTNLGFINDFLFFTESNNSKTLNHFLVADSTNKRVLDLVVETDLNGNIINNSFYNGNVIPYLNWVTYDIIPGNKNNFVSLDITEKVKDYNGNEMRAVVCGVANYNASSKSAIKKTKGGSVLIYDYRMNLDNCNDTDEQTYNNRFGRMYDSIGKDGDSFYDYDTSDNQVGYINGLKKVTIENLDGRNFDSDNLKDYNQLKLLLCDEFGVNEYYINSSNTIGNTFFYYWKNNTTRSLNTKFFGLEDPNYDKNIIAASSAVPSVLQGRFKPFSSNYYNRVHNGNAYYRTNYAPIKAPIIPVDVKVLPNGNWLVLNGYSGDIEYTYRNPYDELTYTASGKYYGEVIEIGFDTFVGFNYPVIIWSSNQFESYAIDNYINVTNYNEEDINNWNRVLDDLDGMMYSPESSPIGYTNNIVGGWKYKNKTLKAPKSIDR